MINGNKPFLEEDEAPVQELGQAGEWRKDDGLSADQRREKSGAEGSGGSNSSGARTPKLREVLQNNCVNHDLPINKTSAIQKTKYSSE